MEDKEIINISDSFQWSLVYYMVNIFGSNCQMCGAYVVGSHRRVHVLR